MPLLYLSPSLQAFNPYVNGGNEQYYMNRITDMMEPLLITNGIQYERNEIDTNLRHAIAESNSGNYDLHLAIHSNAAPLDQMGAYQGCDVYYRPTSFQAKDAAIIIADNFKNIYPNPNLAKAIPTTSLAELNQTKAPAVLIETAYHDNTFDAQWIKENLFAIATNLVESLTLYFDIPFLFPAIPPKPATVTTQGGNLNLRQKPSLNSPIITKIPNQSSVTILGSYENWYVINWPANTQIQDTSPALIKPGSFTMGITGYVHKDYIATKALKSS